MSNIDVNDLSQIIRQVDGNHDLGAGALAEAILDHLPSPRIIHTHSELEALDLDTVLIGRTGDVVLVREIVDYEMTNLDVWLPAVEVATDSHYKVCRKTLEGES